jgi:hypothetical protein
LSPARLCVSATQRIAPLIDCQIELGDFHALRRQREILVQAGLADFLAGADELLLDSGA